MASEGTGATEADATPGGVVAEHPARRALPLFVAPAIDDRRNTYRPELAPVACCRLDDARFGFESSFVAAGAAKELRRLAALLRGRPGVVASVFGHADPTGDDDFNKALSGRRAAAVYGLLTRDVALWEDLYSRPLGGDDWGTASIQAMLDALGHHPGSLDGVQDPATTQAIVDFQAASDLPADGVAGPATRASLFAAYMDVTCVDPEGQPFRLEKTDFLARGTDPAGKGDYQGCGELNPVLVFSEEERQRFAQAFDKTERNRENAPNRRVLIYLFRPGARVDPARWPCPRAEEGPAGCKERLWSDAEARRAPGDARRTYSATGDTFACRFYDRFAARSPCEGARPALATALVAGRLPSLCSIARTFPKPSSIPMLREVARRAAADPALRVLVVGHSDRTGADGMNLALSRGRAAAVRAFLIGDAAFFRARFEQADPVSKWDWEEIQWMLSAHEIDGDPCYAGFVDGHCSDMTHAALQSFQLAVGMDATHTCNEDTLRALIDAYLGTLGPDRPKPAQVQIAGGGSWHPPRTFGEGTAPIQELLTDTDRHPGFRRVEVFLGAGPFRPPASACAPGRHDACAAYEAWCGAVVEELYAAQSHTMAIRVVDILGQPLGQLGIDILAYPPDEGEMTIASLTTTRYGLIRLSAPPGPYALRFTIGGEERRAAFHVHADEVGGMTVRLRESRARLGR